MSAHLRGGRDRPPFFSVAFLVPLGRLADVPVWGKILGAAAAVAAGVLSDVFTPLLALLVASAFVDHVLGRKAAHRSKAYDADTARAGAYSKVGGLLLLLLIRGFEGCLAIAGLGQSNGMLAVALGVGLFVIDVESVEKHRRALGGRPIPGLAQLLTLLRDVPGRILGAFLPDRVRPARRSK